MRHMASSPVTWMRWRKGRPSGGRCCAHGQADAAVGMQAHDVPVQNCFKINSVQRCQLVPCGHYKHQAIRAVRAAGQALACRPAHAHVADAQVGRAFLHGVQHGRAQVFLQVDLDLAVLARKRAQVFGQKLEDGRDVGVHPHMAAHAFGVFAQFALHALQPEKHGARMVQQAFARRGRG